MNLFLFDIDGTLIQPRGVGQRAADSAFEYLHGIADIMDGIITCGQTDPLILKQMYQKAFKRENSAEESKKFYTVYLECLKAELEEEKSLEVLPGVLYLLEYLAERDDVLLALGTGNIEPGAWLKLKYAGLKDYFQLGGFGSDSEDRAKLLKIGLIKARMRFNDDRNFQKVFVVGDTPMDIINGKKIGAETIAVATGLFPKSQLYGHEPSHLLENLDNSYINDLI